MPEQRYQFCFWLRNFFHPGLHGTRARGGHCRCGRVRSWLGLHRLSQSRVHDATALLLGHPLLYNASAAWTGQPVC
ncbi:hypothetical protein FKM82_024486 [Ascaphus truei]